MYACAFGLFKAETGAFYSGKHFWAEQCMHVPLACLKLKLGPFTVANISGLNNVKPILGPLTVANISGLSVRYCVYAWPSMDGCELCSIRLQS